MHAGRRFVTISPIAIALIAATTFAGCATDRTSSQHLDGRALAYRQAFADAAGRSFVSTIDHDALAKELRAARVLWLGDQHRSSRLHALQSELLTALRDRGFSLTLVLEAIGTADAPAVQRFLTHDITLLQLRQIMRERWRGSWLDDLELDVWFYRSLLSSAATDHLPVVPLEPTPRAPLYERDAAMAEVVRQAAAAHPDDLIVVIVGQAHLLGAGDLIAKTGLPSVAIGGELTAPLQAAVDGPTERCRLRRSDTGMLWFGELCRAPN